MDFPKSNNFLAHIYSGKQLCEAPDRQEINHLAPPDTVGFSDEESRLTPAFVFRLPTTTVARGQAGACLKARLFFVDFWSGVAFTAGNTR